MRFNSAVLSTLYAASFLAGAHADDAATTTLEEKPSFTPASLSGAPFLEQFGDDWKSRWTVSKAKKDDPKSEEDWAYVGEWEVEEPYKFQGIKGDKGLVVKSAAAHHAISAKFPKKIDNKGKTFVAQYEVKLQDDLNCGGAYMKLLQDNKKLHAEEFSNSAPYIIMFGPDKCGTTNKVHFIVRHKNPKTGEYEEKHLKSPPMAKMGSLTNLYTLIIEPDQSFQIRINGEAIKNGTLLEDFDPPFNPAKEIDDPKDSKPDSWVDEARIADPEAKKPEDWDEEAPLEILDEEAEKPDDWLDNEPLQVPDPEAEKPDDWEDEEDGDWIAPRVPNPKCDEVSGCGEWKRPTKRNPEYKGKWSAPMIENAAYKGEWAPRKIKNPDFFEDKTPSNLEPMGAIGFEIWTMQKDIMFDNIYIGHSVADAEKLKAETFDIKRPIEEKEEEVNKPEPPPVAGGPTVSLKEDPVEFIKQKVNAFVTIAKTSPIDAVKQVPEVAGAAGVLLATILAVALAGAGASSPQVQAKAKEAADKAKVAKDKAVDAAASGADKVSAEINKRTTRSAAS